MSSLGDGNDVVNAGGQRMGIPQALVHRLAADATDRLGQQDLLFIPVKGQTVSTILIRPVALLLCRG